MELIGYYALFAFSISISACYIWFWPLVQEATLKNTDNGFTRFPVLSAVIYILVSAVAAPILILPMFSETMAERFKKGLQNEIFKPD